MNEEGLRDWFGKSKSKDGKKGWVNVVTGGTCASDEPGEGTPKCVSSAKRASMSKAERLSAQRRKKAADPGQQQKTGASKPTYVSTDPQKKMKEEKLLTFSEVRNAYAVGMAQAMKSTGDKPPLKKSTITKAHEIAKAIKKEEKDHEVSMAHKQLDKTIKNAKKLKKDLGSKEKNIPAWVQAKITDADHNVDAASGYMDESGMPTVKPDKKTVPMPTVRSRKNPAPMPTVKPKDIGEAKDKKGKGSGKKDACYHKVKSRYDVWPSAYASGALVKCRKVGAANWGEELEMQEKCWDGYTEKGMKKKGNRMVPNCVPVKENCGCEEPKMMRYCPKCGKNETRDECSYGPRTWDMYSMPVRLTPNQKKFDIATVAPANEENVTEKYERIQRQGKTYTVFFTFRGQYKSLQFFFPTAKRPSREDVLIQLRKVYPDAILVNYFERDRVENEPLVQVEGAKSFGKFIAEASPLGYNQGNKDDINRGTAGSTEVDATRKLLDAIRTGGRRTQAKKKPTTQMSGYETEGEMVEGAAWTKKSGKNPEGGLNEKGRKSYERENPGSDLKAPSKKVGNKRRASFCARMKGMKSKLTSAKTANDPDSRINKSLRAWNC